MNISSALFAAALLLPISLGSQQVGPDRFTGTLDTGDRQLPGGEYFDRIPLPLEAGQEVTVTLTSSEFDTYLILTSPGGEQWDSDDWDGRMDMSRIDLIPEEGGDWFVTVTSFLSGETGDYQVEVGYRVAQAGAGAAQIGYVPVQQLAASIADLAEPTLDLVQPLEVVRREVQEGRLAPNLTSKQAMVTREQVTVTRSLSSGQHLTATLVSEDFDTYLTITSPSGLELTNDDWHGSTSWSRLEVQVEEAGTWSIGVSAYSPGGAGLYELETLVGTPVITNRWLGDGSGMDERNRYIDEFTFRGNAGDVVRAEMVSDDGLDTLIRLVSPSGVVSENDDWQGHLDVSRVEERLTEDGTWTVIATSYGAEEEGEYRLVIATLVEG